MLYFLMFMNSMTWEFEKKLFLLFILALVQILADLQFLWILKKVPPGVSGDKHNLVIFYCHNLPLLAITKLLLDQAVAGNLFVLVNYVLCNYLFLSRLIG